MDCFLFSGLKQTERERLTAAFGEAECFEKGAELYRPGSLGLLVSGRARIVRLGEKKVTVRGIDAGELFGAASVFGAWNGKSSVVASEGCSVRYLSEEALRQALLACPQAAVNFAVYLSERVRFLNRRLDMLTAADGEQKVYAFLCAQADGEGRVRLEYGLAELARRLQMARSSLYRALDALCEAGWIARDKKTFIIY